jgi:hypothetical protein
VAAIAQGALWWVSNGNSATQVANPSNLLAGQYDIRVRVSAVANIPNNLELWVGATKITGLKVGVSQGPPGAAASGQLLDSFFSRVTLDGASGISVKVALADGPATPYQGLAASMSSAWVYGNAPTYYAEIQAERSP